MLTACRWVARATARNTAERGHIIASEIVETDNGDGTGAAADVADAAAELTKHNRSN